MGESSEQFLTTVQQKASVPAPPPSAPREAVLTTLAERISAGEARDLAALLPPGWPVASHDHAGGGLRRGRVPAPGGRARGVTSRPRSVMPAPSSPRSAGSCRRARSTTWSPSSRRLRAADRGGRGTVPRAHARRALIQRVADRAGLYPDGARRGDRRRARDARRADRGRRGRRSHRAAPRSLHPPLERGKAASGGQATRMSLERFWRASRNVRASRPTRRGSTPRPSSRRCARRSRSVSSSTSPRSCPWSTPRSRRSRGRLSARARHERRTRTCADRVRRHAVRRARAARGDRALLESRRALLVVVIKSGLAFELIEPPASSLNTPPAPDSTSGRPSR